MPVRTRHRYAFGLAERKDGPYSKWAPLCGQRDAGGVNWAKTGYTDDPAAVTCLKCLRLMSNAVTGYREAA